MKNRYLLLLLSLFTACIALCSETNNHNAIKWLEESYKVQNTAPSKSIYYAQKVLELTPDDVKSDLRAEALYSLSQAEKLLGNFDSSIIYLYDAKDFVTSSNKLLLGRIYSMIGMLYCSLSDYRKAIEFNDKATSIFKSENDTLSLAMSYNDRGIIHCYLEEFPIAEQFLKRSLVINRSQNNIKNIAANLNNLCLYKGNFNEQLEFIQEAIEINKRHEALWSLGENYNNLGRLYFFSKQYEQAEQVLEDAFEIASKIGAKELICDNHEYASWVYHALGDYNQAFDALLKLHLLNKELQSSHKLRITEHDILHKKQLKERQAAEIREQELELELLRRNRSLLIIGFVLLAITSLFLIFWNKRKRNIQLISAQYDLEQSERKIAQLTIVQQRVELQSTQIALESSRQEATSFALFLQSRNEVLDKIRYQLKEGYKLDSLYLLSHIKKVNTFISQHQSGEKCNNAFLLKIEEKNHEYLNRLAIKHPNLTQGEKTLATFLRVDLSSKDIAIITGTTPKTINMNRYRLRKSLNIATEEDLNSYLQNI